MDLQLEQSPLQDDPAGGLPYLRLAASASAT